MAATQPTNEVLLSFLVLPRVILDICRISRLNNPEKIRSYLAAEPAAATRANDTFDGVSKFLEGYQNEGYRSGALEGHTGLTALLLKLSPFIDSDRQEKLVEWVAMDVSKWIEFDAPSPNFGLRFCLHFLAHFYPETSKERITVLWKEVERVATTDNPTDVGKLFGPWKEQVSASSLFDSQFDDWIRGKRPGLLNVGQDVWTMLKGPNGGEDACYLLNLCVNRMVSDYRTWPLPSSRKRKHHTVFGGVN
jgi:hypothetical protein